MFVIPARSVLVAGMLQEAHEGKYFFDQLNYQLERSAAKSKDLRDLLLRNGLGL
jgi:hypothetical protein